MSTELNTIVEKTKAYLTKNLKDKEFLCLISFGKDSMVLHHLINSIESLSPKYVYVSLDGEADQVTEFIKRNSSDIEIKYTPMKIDELITSTGYLPKVRANYTYCYYLTAVRELVSKYDTVLTGAIVGDRSSGNPIGNLFPLKECGWTKDYIEEYTTENNIEISPGYELYGISALFALSPLMKNKKSIAEERSPILGKRIKSAAYTCWRNNSALQTAFKTADEYWENYLSIDYSNGVDAYNTSIEAINADIRKAYLSEDAPMIISDEFAAAPKLLHTNKKKILLQLLK